MKLISRIYSQIQFTSCICRQYRKPFDVLYKHHPNGQSYRNRIMLFHSRKNVKLLNSSGSFLIPSSALSTSRARISCKSTLNQILETIPPESDALSPSDTLNIVRGLHETVRKSSCQSNSLYHVTNHRNFNVLCEALKVSLPYFEISDQIDILNAIKSLSVPVGSEIFNAILLSFHENLFNMSLNEIMLLDRILCSSEKSQTINELRRSLIERFNLKSSKLRIEFNYFAKMQRWLQFIDRNRHGIIDEVFDNMENCAAKQHIEILTAKEAMEMIILLSSFGKRSEYVWPILDKAFDVWHNSTEVTMRMVQLTLRILVRSNRFRNNVNRYKDSRFVETCARTAISNDDYEKCFLILQYLNQLGFASKKLIDFLLDHLKDHHRRESRTDKKFIYNCTSISIACDIGNHRPPLFYDFLVPLLQSIDFHHQLDIHLNWPKFALTLHSLGIHQQPLKNEILKRRSQFETYDGFEALECLEMERMVNANIQCLISDFKRAIGKHMRLLASTDDGTIVPMLVRIDIHSKKLVRFDDDKIDWMSSTQCDNTNQCLIALITPQMQNLQLFGSNLLTIALNPNEWIDIVQHRTHTSLCNGINHHIKKQNLKLEQINRF